jgi:hypothetical protein
MDQPAAEHALVGASLGATRTNDLPTLPTYLDSGRKKPVATN